MKIDLTKEADPGRKEDPGTVIRVEVEVEAQGEQPAISVPGDMHFLATIRAQLGLDAETHLFERDSDEPLAPPPEGRKAIRVVAHRCGTVKVAVRYEHRTEEHPFRPSATVFKILQWAVSKQGFDLDPVAAAKANLILPGAASPLPREDVIGKYTTPGECALIVDLTLKDFSNG